MPRSKVCFLQCNFLNLILKMPLHAHRWVDIVVTRWIRNSETRYSKGQTINYGSRESNKFMGGSLNVNALFLLFVVVVVFAGVNEKREQILPKLWACSDTQSQYISLKELCLQTVSGQTLLSSLLVQRCKHDTALWKANILKQNFLLRVSYKQSSFNELYGECGYECN